MSANAVIWLAIALGGAGGALMRYAMTALMADWLGRAFPWGTLTVNIAGSLAIGLLYVWLVERHGASDALRLGLMTGLLGALTTFSSFSLETVALLEDGRFAAGLANAGISVLACIAACAGGIWAARQALG